MVVDDRGCKRFRYYTADSVVCVQHLGYCQRHTGATMKRYYATRFWRTAPYAAAKELSTRHGTNNYAEVNNCQCRFCRDAVAEYQRQTTRIQQTLASGVQ